MKDKTSFYDSGMWKGAPPENFIKAKSLRSNQTKAETILWDKLKNNQVNK